MTMTPNRAMQPTAVHSVHVYEVRPQGVVAFTLALVRWGGVCEVH